MAVLLILIAGVLAGLSNLCMRRSIDAGGSSRAFIVVQFSVSFLAALALNPLRTGCYACDSRVLLLGAIAGLFVVAMMLSLGKALEKGPPGLSIAAVNASTVVPGLVMALLFGTVWGFEYTAVHAAGSVVMVAGFLWAGWDAQARYGKGAWTLFTAAAFALHALLLCILQWRALMLGPPKGSSLLVPWQLISESAQWFMPTMFLTAAAVQLVVYWRVDRRWPNSKELRFGLVAGLLTGVCTYLLIRAPEVATPHENAIIFPLYAVTVTVVCNCWGRMLYHERVNWVASSVCLGGLFAATVDWTAVLT